jgi:hypothetical protein
MWKMSLIFIMFVAVNRSFGLGPELLDNHRLIKGVGAQELLPEYGQALADKTQRYLTTESGKKFITTKEGKELLKHEKWLSNYLFLQKVYNFFAYVCAPKN